MTAVVEQPEGNDSMVDGDPLRRVIIIPESEREYTMIQPIYVGD